MKVLRIRVKLLNHFSFFTHITSTDYEKYYDILPSQPFSSLHKIGFRIICFNKACPTFLDYKIISYLPAIIYFIYSLSKNLMSVCSKQDYQLVKQSFQQENLARYLPLWVCLFHDNQIMLRMKHMIKWCGRCCSLESFVSYRDSYSYLYKKSNACRSYWTSLCI